MRVAGGQQPWPAVPHPASVPLARVWHPTHLLPSDWLTGGLVRCVLSVVRDGGQARSHATKLFGFFLWLSGPYLSTVLTADVNEQAAVWCFMSICQM